MLLPDRMGIITIVIAADADGISNAARSFVQGVPDSQVPIILREVANDLARELVSQAGLAPHDESVPHAH